MLGLQSQLMNTRVVVIADNEVEQVICNAHTIHLDNDDNQESERDENENEASDAEENDDNDEQSLRSTQF